jgi:hypothetical protein
MNTPVMKKSLKFHDEALEQVFHEEKKAYQMNCLKTLLISNFFYAVVTMGINPSNLDALDLFYIMSYIANFIILGLIYTIVKRKKLSVGRAIPLYVFYGILLLSEHGRRSKRVWNIQLFFHTGSTVQSLFLSLLLSKIYWLDTTVVMIIGTALIGFRFTDFNDYEMLRFYPAIIYSLFAVAIPMANYYLEREERKSFFKIKHYEFSLSCFRDLIKNVIPSSIIISAGDDILFSNEQSDRLFRASNSKILKSNLKTMTLEEKGTDFTKIPIGPLASSPRSCQRRGFSFDSSSRDAHSINKDFEDEKLKNLFDAIFSKKVSKGDFVGYTGTFENSNGLEVTDTNKGNLFDIKISNLVWEKRDASIVIINEDPSLKKMYYLKEQSLYKDKLLATVSHDLRTPLNGIIGMIDLVMQIVTDREILKR